MGFGDAGIAGTNIHREVVVKLNLYDNWYERLCARLKAYEEVEVNYHAFSKSVLGRQQTSALHPGRLTPEVYVPQSQSGSCDGCNVSHSSDKTCHVSYLAYRVVYSLYGLSYTGFLFNS